MAEEGFKWIVTPGQAFDELWSAYTNTLFQAGARVANSRATEMEAWMKQNAPWTDRTGIARQSLYADAEQDAVRVAAIRVGYRPEAPHGLWLEIAYGGKWAIITRTIDRWGSVVWKDIQNMMNLGLISSD
jgi:hypothetical protein